MLALESKVYVKEASTLRYDGYLCSLGWKVCSHPLGVLPGEGPEEAEHSKEAPLKCYLLMYDGMCDSGMCREMAVLSLRSCWI